ncbi:unnamed protein product [Vitrella brassicaformis CCMP3155]|uniref:Uncharacterized protein n=1 Tax=Vitrella brassicaformis (strain CCMP3155) TaxID=1169540 RepID=A0A0G4EDH6_VITBC|nr:unnamed protein product [Vitrella brassicaformis CCMP3155]|eukprot:CEL93425.1 unnamed protein product [Vitrella brassicaformis CCMP3155]
MESPAAAKGAFLQEPAVGPAGTVAHRLKFSAKCRTLLMLCVVCHRQAHHPLAKSDGFPPNLGQWTGTRAE